VVFRGGYHGGVLYFATGVAPWNAPYRFVVAPYNDLHGTTALIDEQADDVAAVLVEPMQGSGGCLPADAAFIQGTFAAARDAGAVCIADEVMTSRHGRSGLLHLLGAQADITTFGKYIGGGFSFGAFGGAAELLDLFDTSPEGGRADTIAHAGTFNNNVATMTAGGVVLGEVFTADVAEAHTARGHELREQIASVLARHALPMSVTGFGSSMNLHACRPSTSTMGPTTVDEVLQRDEVLQELVYLGLLERGIYTAPRGMINLGLAHSDDQLAAFLDRLDDCLAILGETARPGTTVR
jgi:glutamate-1-semialdehyde 2,1-aminomutase